MAFAILGRNAWLDPKLGGRTNIEGNSVSGPPELVVEISYSSWSVDLNDKLRTYEAAGVREYLVVDVHGEILHWFLSNDGRFGPMIAGESELLRSITFPRLWIDPAVFFRATISRVLDALNRGLEHAAFVTKLEAASCTGPFSQKSHEGNRFDAALRIDPARERKPRTENHDIIGPPELAIEHGADSPSASYPI